MEQLIQEIKTWVTESREFTPRKDGMMIKNIIDEPTYHNSGRLHVSKGKCGTFHELKNVNFIFLNSNKPFDLLLDDAVLINTSQFSFMNRHRDISVAIQAFPNEEFFIDFCYGNVKLGDEQKAFHSLYSSKWDITIKNIITSPICSNSSIHATSNLNIGG